MLAPTIRATILQAAAAGGFAATVMFPVDMAKTRMQACAQVSSSHSLPLSRRGVPPLRDPVVVGRLDVGNGVLCRS